MTESEKMIEQMYRLYNEYMRRIREIDKELELNDGRNSSIVIKTIKGKPYYYEQWREGDSIKCINLGRVVPGEIAEREKALGRRKELQAEKEELLFLSDEAGKTYERLRKHNKEKLLNDYSFEVFHKDEISARVSVRGANVYVNRIIIHPVKQLFCNDRITRNQLNEVFRLRCIDENRPDIQDKLKFWGLTEYNPQMIVRKTHGVSYNDYLWFRFEGENLKAADVLVRD